MSRKYTAGQVAEALVKAHGIVTVAADALGCTRATVYRYIEQYKTVKDALGESRAVLLDNVEGALYDKAVNDKDLRAIMYVLDNIGKERGYGKAQAQPQALTATQDNRVQIVNIIGLEQYRELVRASLATPAMLEPGTPGHVRGSHVEAL